MSTSEQNTDDSHMAGKLSIPDLSAIHSGQANNLEAMAAATVAASKTLQEIIQQQQQTLEQVVGNFGNSLQNVNLSPATASLENMQTVTQQFTETSQKITQTSEQSMQALVASVQASLAKIEETAIKFSGG